MRDKNRYETLYSFYCRCFVFLRLRLNDFFNELKFSTQGDIKNINIDFVGEMDPKTVSVW